MLAEVVGVMPSGIKVKFVRHMTGGQNLVERRGSGPEAIVVLISAVKIDFQSGQICCARQGDRAVSVPERGVCRTSKNAPKHARTRRIGHWAEKHGEFFDERSAMRADGNELLRMPERQM